MVRGTLGNLAGLPGEVDGGETTGKASGSACDFPVAASPALSACQLQL